MTIARRIDTDIVHHNQIENYSTCTYLSSFKCMVVTASSVFCLFIKAQDQWTSQVELNLPPSKMRLGSNNRVVILYACTRKYWLILSKVFPRLGGKQV